MNKQYKTLNLYAAWLVEVDPQLNRNMGGIKNIIGVKTTYNGENLFFSLLDDCFFRVFPQNVSIKDMCKGLQRQLFVQIYEYRKPPYEFKTFGMELYDYTKKDYITKQEIIELKKDEEFLFGYQSDFSYKSLSTDTIVDYENSQTIKENIIDTVEEFEEKRQRPLSYENNCIYGPHHYKRKILKMM